MTIGYDTPWRQVHALLIEAAQAIPEILTDPPPYVVQTALSDFYVAYKLVVNVGIEVPAARARVASDLHAAIQDAFNRHGVQIMSPHYYRDPSEPKLVPESNWYPRLFNERISNETPSYDDVTCRLCRTDSAGSGWQFPTDVPALGYSASNMDRTVDPRQDFIITPPETGLRKLKFPPLILTLAVFHYWHIISMTSCSNLFERQWQHRPISAIVCNNRLATSIGQQWTSHD